MQTLTGATLAQSLESTLSQATKGINPDEARALEPVAESFLNRLRDIVMPPTPDALTLEISREEFDDLVRQLYDASCIVGAIRDRRDQEYEGGALGVALKVIENVAGELDAALPRRDGGAPSDAPQFPVEAEQPAPASEREAAEALAPVDGTALPAPVYHQELHEALSNLCRAIALTKVVTSGPIDEIDAAIYHFAAEATIDALDVAYDAMDRAITNLEAPAAREAQS